MNQEKVVEILLYVAYVALALGVGAILFSIIMMAIRKPRALLQQLAGLAGLLVLYGISYAIQGSEVPAFLLSYGLSAETVRMLGALLITTYILGAASFVLLIGSEILRWVR